MGKRFAFLMIGLCLLAACETRDRAAMSKSTESKSDAEMAKAAKEAEAAEEEVARLRASTKTPKAAKRSVASHAGPHTYAVQIGTFKVEENAAKMVEKLKAAGLPVFSKRIERDGGVVLHAVRLESTKTRAESEQRLESVAKATTEKPVVISIAE